MADIKDLIKGDIAEIDRRIKSEIRSGIDREIDRGFRKAGEGIANAFSKKEKYTENEDGSISREIKVGKQKLNVTAIKSEDGNYIVTDMPALDEKNAQKMIEKISKGKRLSKDEQLWTNVLDRTAVALALQGMEYDNAATMALLPYTKEELIGEQNVGTFFVKAQQFEGDKTAFLAGVKQQMIAAYGAEAGEKHFNDFVTMSGLTDELQKLADKERTAAEAQKPETVKVEMAQAEPVKEQPTAEVQKPEQVKEEPVVEPARTEPTVEVKREEPEAEAGVDEKKRESLRETMKADAGKAAVSTENQGNDTSLKNKMKNDGKIAATRNLLNISGVKLADKEATLNKLVENFGAVAAYEIALKCVVEPANAMSAMGEEFKRSGASLEYFASIDPNDKEKMAKVEKLAGVPLMPLKDELIKQRMPSAAEMRGMSPMEHMANMPFEIRAPELKTDNLMAERKYNEMCKKLNKEALNVADLVNVGATRQDFDTVLLKMFDKENCTSENIQSKVEKGFGLEGTSPVTKDFAVEVIGRVEQRNMMKLRSKRRNR